MSARPVSCVVRRLMATRSPLVLAPGNKGIASAALKVSFPQQYVQNSATRSMVMVTSTKAGEIPPPPPKPATSEDDATTLNVKIDSSASTEKLIISESCYKRIKLLAKKKNQSLSELYLRVFVDAGGCSGFTYQFELTTDELEEDDVVFQDPEGARVVVDEGSLELIQGSTIDYVQEMIKSAFEVRENPQSESACGCGSSFALKNFAANPARD